MVYGVSVEGEIWGEARGVGKRGKVCLGVVRTEMFTFKNGTFRKCRGYQGRSLNKNDSLLLSPSNLLEQVAVLSAPNVRR